MFEQIGDGVFRRRYPSLDLNVGVVIGDDGILIVDTRSTEREAGELRRDLGSLTRLPVRWAVNTHWHFDHAFGNAVFQDAEIWGHELTRIALNERGEEMRPIAKKWLPPGDHDDIDRTRIVAPAKTFAERAAVAIGRQVELTHHGLGHTDADIVVRVPDAEVAFFGDLIEEGGPPTFPDSYPAVWPLTLGLAARDLPGVVVPGHGELVDAGFVWSQLEDLEAVAGVAARYVAGEIPLGEAVTSGPYQPETMRDALRRAKAVAGTASRELCGEGGPV